MTYNVFRRDSEGECGEALADIGCCAIVLFRNHIYYHVPPRIQSRKSVPKGRIHPIANARHFQEGIRRIKK